MGILQTFLIVFYCAIEVFWDYMVVVIILGWIPGIWEKRWYQIMYKGISWYISRFTGWIVIGPIDFTPILGFLLLRGVLWALLEIIKVL